MVDLFIRARALVNRLLRRHGMQITHPPQPLPRKLWLFWAQGETSAPQIVQTCIASWRAHHPDWDITVITAETLPDYLADISFGADVSWAHKSDLLRLRLLREQGGVWVDATCYCARPLDDWLPPLMQAGFFAFHRPVAGRIMGNWFMAASPENPIITHMTDLVTAYWRRHDRAINYFFFHYMMEWSLLTNRRFRATWRVMPKISADGPHTVYAAGRAGQAHIPPEVLATLPLHKLSWKEDLPPPLLAQITGGTNPPKTP